MADTEVTNDDKPLENHWWWRLAQAIFIMCALLVASATVFVTVYAVLQVETINESESTIVCNSGTVIKLDEFVTGAGMYYLNKGSIADGRFSYYVHDAQTKIFCVFLENKGEITVARALYLTREAGGGNRDTLKDISGRSKTKTGSDMGYTIIVEDDYTNLGLVGLYFLIAVLIEVAVFVTIRGIARYTLIGKFF